jgi:microcystin-dependent protein
VSDPYLGEIKMFAGNYAPQDWHFCDGSLLQISAYSALYSLIGATYGGDGVTNFALPDLRGRLPIGMGQGPGLSNYNIGAKDGAETATVTLNQLPAHTHAVNASTATGTQSNPQNGVWASVAGGNQFITRAEVTSASVIRDMNSQAIGSIGSGTAHNNVMPSFPLSYIICIQNGLWPDRP